MERPSKQRPDRPPPPAYRSRSASSYVGAVPPVLGESIRQHRTHTTTFPTRPARRRSAVSVAAEPGQLVPTTGTASPEDDALAKERVLTSACRVDSSPDPTDGINYSDSMVEPSESSPPKDEIDVVITRVDDLVIKTFPDGSTVVIRPDGTKLRTDPAGDSTRIDLHGTESEPLGGCAPDAASVDRRNAELSPAVPSAAIPDFDPGDGASDTDPEEELGSETGQSEPEEAEYDSDISEPEPVVDAGGGDNAETASTEEWTQTSSFCSGAAPIICSAGSTSSAALASTASVPNRSRTESLATRIVSVTAKRVPAVSVSSGCPFQCGWLFKEGGSYKSWKRRWFELYESGQLLYYDAQRECGGKFINSVDISNSVVAANPHSKRPFGFVIQTVSDLTGVSNKRSKYFLAASNTQDRDRWMTSLQLSANHADNDDFYSSSFATAAPVRVAHGSIGSPVDGSSAGPAESPLDGVDGSNSVFDVDAAAGISNEAPPSNPKPFKHQESSKRMRWNPTSKIRALVSKKKLRFQERGPSGHQYDLDLGYITERIIAMGYPSDGTEGLYRNKWEEVKMFMEDFHRQRYRLYNLCSEKAYPPQRFMNRVAVYPFNDHGVPPLSLVQLCCKDMVRWLDSDPLNVCAVHCKAGKGRTGLIVACFLLHTGVAASASEVLELYGTQRCADARGVTIPSQIRYVEYYAQHLKGLIDLCNHERRVLHELLVNSIPYEQSGTHPFPYYIEIEQDAELVYTSKDTLENNIVEEQSPGLINLKLKLMLEISGDVVVRFMDKNPSSHQICAVCFHVGYSTSAESDRLDFGKANVDNPHKSKLLKRADDSFGIALTFGAIDQ